MKCGSPNCPNRARPGRNRGLCGKHYNAAPARGYVDPEPSRERLKLLRSRGVTLRMLDEHGVSRCGVRRINAQPRIRALTEAKLFAIPVPELLPTGASVDGVGTGRRIRALVALGYTQAMIADELGTGQTAVSAIAHRELVTAGTRAAVAELFDRWCMTPGPSQLSRDRARAAGWHPPLAWDDIDDPDEQPNVGDSEKVAFPDRYAELQELGIPRPVMHERLGVQKDSFDRQLARYREAV